MHRFVLSDAQWDRIFGLIIGRPDQRGSTGRDNRMFVEGVLWIVRTGSPWRDLPEAFGEWNSVVRRLSRWSSKGVWCACADNKYRPAAPVAPTIAPGSGRARQAFFLNPTFAMTTTAVR
jgi:putative transposase